MKIKPLYAGLAGGILWGAVMFAATLASVYADGYGGNFLVAMSSIYPGYAISVAGSFIGLLYGFVDGFVALFVIAWLYNMFDKKKR